MDKYICKAKATGCAWWSKPGEWVYGYYVAIPDEYCEDISHAIFTSECEHICYGEYKDWGWHEVDPETVCRCTGKEDKHGNPIFENDICKVNVPYGPLDESGGYEFKSWIATCKFDQFSAGFVMVNNKYGDIYRWFGTGMYSDLKDELVEIIGNKFDNTNLMEE